MTARRKVEVSLRTVTSGDAVPLTTRKRPFRKKRSPGPQVVVRPRPCRLRGSQPIPGSRPARLQTRRSRRSSRRSSFHGPPGRPAAAAVRPIEVRCSATCTALRRIVLRSPPAHQLPLAFSHPPASQHHAIKHPAALRSQMCEGVQGASLSPQHHTSSPPHMRNRQHLICA